MTFQETERGLAVDLTLNLPSGLHSRPSARLAHLAQGFVSDILLIGENGEVDAKSMLDILSLASPAKARLKLIAKGPDAAAALAALYDFLTSKRE